MKQMFAIFKLLTEEIPDNPAAEKFRQGGTLGTNRRHWFRAKFFKQYRLFFRFDSSRKIIIAAWVNDDSTLRARGNRNDAYAVFKKMLNRGNPPDDFDSLLKEAQASTERVEDILNRKPEN